MSFLADIWTAAGGAPDAARAVTITGEGALPSVFGVTELATGSIGAAALAAATLIAARHGVAPPVTVDRRLASAWFGMTIRPDGWSLPPAWDPIAGDYRTQDGWIRLHTNAPHHRDAVLRVLRVPAERDAVATAVAGWTKDALESAVVAEKGCAAAMHTLAEWAAHPQGQAVAAEPILHVAAAAEAPRPGWAIDPARPLRGIRVLDLTRVLAGPVATRFLAGLGAEVLRIDPPDWEEPSLIPSTTRGKRSARLDLRAPEGRAAFERLLAGADVFVNGYRNGALAGLGYDADRRQAIRPGLVDVCLDAYGWTGPWSQRRGFDSLVQMSSGIADAGMRRLGKDKPHPLPVQALDHACGYIVATAVLMGLLRRLQNGAGTIARASLARTAALLVSRPAVEAPPPAPLGEDDLTAPDTTGWGSARWVRSPVQIGGHPLRFASSSRPLGGDSPTWGV